MIPFPLNPRTRLGRLIAIAVNGRCHDCGQAAQGGSARCLKCARRTRNMECRRRAMRIAEGKCGKCARKSETRMCQTCRAKNKTRMGKYNERRRAR